MFFIYHTPFLTLYIMFEVSDLINPGIILVVNHFYYINKVIQKRIIMF
jgi:hypothetical protein